MRMSSISLDLVTTRRAFNRMEQVYKDGCIVAVYDIISDFCKCISQSSKIGRNKDCPDDINETVSSLIFASARFGNMPELICLRKLFSELYGKLFVTTALELLPGHNVNFQIIENLSAMKKVPADEVLKKLFDEIVQSSVTEVVENRFDPESSSENSTTPSDDDMVAEDEEKEEMCVYDTIKEFGIQSSDFVNENDLRGFVFEKNHLKKYEMKVAKRSWRKSSVISENIECPIYYEKRKGCMSMPCQRTKCIDEHNESDGVMKRSYSLPAPSPSHVHPKLPDCDQFDAEFTSLKVGTRRSRRKRLLSPDNECAGYYKNGRGSNHLYIQRSISMPSEPKSVVDDETRGGVKRSYSLPAPSPPHVHPKQPNYDDMVAELMALKEEYLLNHS